MPMLHRQNIGSGRKNWLGSAHGVNHAQTATLDVSTFTADTDYPEGRIPSGTPVNAADRTAVVKWDPAAGGGALGFLIDDVDVVDGEAVPCAVLLHGAVVVEELPVEFTVPTAPTAFIFE